MHPILVQTKKPTQSPISLTELKAHLRITEPEEDEALADLILRATAMLDGPNGALGRCLMAQSWRVAVGAASGPRLFLPIAPASSLLAVRRVAPGGAEEALDPEAFLLCADTDRSWIVPLAGWPALADRPDALAFDIAAGAESAADVPPDLRQAILLLAGAWHAHREAVTEQAARELPLGVAHLVALHRTGWAA